MANVLKVFLENGQTKSFKYDTTTTVKVNFLFCLLVPNPKKQENELKIEDKKNSLQHFNWNNLSKGIIKVFPDEKEKENVNKGTYRHSYAYTTHIGTCVLL